jgi:hypothetical protein
MSAPIKSTATYSHKIEPQAGAIWLNILSAIIATALTACASAPTTDVHETVGPALALNEERTGVLIVYSATAWMRDSDGPSVLSYTDYRIEASDGTLLKQVTNGNEEPAHVALPKGIYTVVAQSDTSGTVAVPVAIETGKATVLHLEREKDWKEPVLRAELVQLPNGQAIGFRARDVRRQAPTIAAAPRGSGQHDL